MHRCIRFPRFHSGLSRSRLGLPLAAVMALSPACGSDDEGFFEGGGDNGSGNGVAGGNGAGAPDSGAIDGIRAPADPDEPRDPDVVPGEVVIHPFVRTEHDPFSTFAADVDSASYDIFVKSVTELNRLPEPRMVRSEEFVNFFRYEYPAVPEESEDPFAIDLDLGPTPSAETVLLRIGVQGRSLPADRAPANLVFLMDVSGSMSAADKLPVAQEMLRNGLDVLRPDDKISLVVYAGRTAVVLEPTPVSEADRIRAAITELRAGGGTAGADGLELAYDQAETGYVEGGINHIVLCTDGDFNIGPHTTAELLEIVESRRERGVTFTALGFGLGNLNDSMMESISNAGNGIYRVISGPQTALRYVEHRLLSDVVQIAKDVKLQVEFNPDHVFAYRQVGYENRQLADEDFRDDLVDAGEIGSGHQMTALYELALTESAVPAAVGAPAMTDGEPVEGEREVSPSELVMVKLRYKAPGAAPSDPAKELRRGLPATASASSLGAETRFAWAAATLASRLRVDPFQTESRLREAGAILEGFAQSGPGERAELHTLFKIAQVLIP